ncbi:MAG: PLP-dependent aminotransferase family protein [Desulfobacteraceae bacterium]|nr:PLP-dependent aminotransferase family protein [Desulfobacteraceae bacterium]
MHTVFAGRTRQMGVNAIREILKVVSQPGMVSLAGGIPAPQSFPLTIVRQLTDSVLTKYGAAALQYDATEGFGPLRQALADHLAMQGIQASASHILITSGSQGALDALGLVLISKGDGVAVEAPTYVGALQAFRPYEPRWVCVPTDDQGLIPEALEDLLRRQPIQFLYLVPTFQNPTGRTILEHRRRAIAHLIQKYDVLLVEDDPYSALRYDGESVPSIKSMAPEHVIYVGTLSKVFAPGLRIGYCVAPKPIQDWLVVAKQGIDLHTSTFNQAMAAEYISGGHMADHLPRILSLYRPRRDAMLDALARYMPAECGWSKPEGGMFIWLRGRMGTDMEEIYCRAVKRKVAFVPGKFFFAQPGHGLETMRLNFTMADEEHLTMAVRTLAEVLYADGSQIEEELTMRVNARECDYQSIRNSIT